MARTRHLIPTDIKDAADADLAADVARRHAFQDRAAKAQRCRDAVKVFMDATGALWVAEPDNARSLLRNVRQSLLAACKALADAGLLEAWKQIDHRRTYNEFRAWNLRIMSRPSYNWAASLLGKACEGMLPLALMKETWET